MADDLISRQAVLAKSFDIGGFSNVVSVYDIATLTAVDAVEVVRCKDCIRWKKDVAGCTDYVGRCEYANYMVGAMGYCVYGEWREEDGT